MNLVFPSDGSSETLLKLLTAGDALNFIADPRVTVIPGQRMFERFQQIQKDSGAGLLYADSMQHRRIDYQTGSIRDNFDFGPLVAVSATAAHSVGLGNWRWGALYDLRLRLSERYPILRIPEPLYSAEIADARPTGEKQFDYVDPRNREYQIEMEQIATQHLQRIGAWLKPSFIQPERSESAAFACRASVIIPVRNREKTVKDAVQSALSQTPPFDFNVIVIDNHSSDGTSALLSSLPDRRLVHLVPQRFDLNIGGCWNEAIFSEHCGRYAVQLDSDDLYADTTALERIVGELEKGPFAMVVGAYTMVNFSLETISPGLIDHREWTPENGRNNALRINGLGAPRAFDVAVLRRIGLPNVSYGEDYALGLRISREYQIGRIYDSLYLCRRWEGNSDSALAPDVANRYDAYKDWIRSNEIRARQMLRNS